MICLLINLNSCYIYIYIYIYQYLLKKKTTLNARNKQLKEELLQPGVLDNTKKVFIFQKVNIVCL